MKNDNRRSFIKKTVLSAAGIGIAGNFPAFAISSRRPSASETVNVALIGCRSMGFNILKHHLDLPGVRCLGLCDVDQNILTQKAAEVEKDYGQKPKLYHDYRNLMDNKDIDAVIIGTPDHWHCLPMIHACEVGKAVYVEKPMANSIGECNLMVKAANRYNAIVQVGQQQRSGQQWMNIMKLIKSGSLGKLRKVEIWGNFNYGIGAPIRPDIAIPAGVDYDFWLGPAPKRETFNTNRFHGNWRMFWDYGGGLMTDWGVHLIDMALWAGDVTSEPETVMAYGKNLSFTDHAHETFDTMSAIFPQKDYVITWQHTAGTQNGPYDMLYGLRFVCDNASIIADRSGYRVAPEWDNDAEAFKTEEVIYEEGVQNHNFHVSNFIDSIKNETRQTNCTPETGRCVALYAHMANIAARTGEQILKWDSQKQKFTNSRKANEFIMPEYRSPWQLPKI